MIGRHLERAGGKRLLHQLILFANLLGHLVPTLIIGFGFVIPGSCIEGMNPQMMGFIACLVGFVVTYGFGVALAWRFGRQQAGNAAALPAS